MSTRADHRIVTTLALPHDALRELGEIGEVVGPDGWEDRLGDASALVSLVTIPVDESLLLRAPRLRVVANAGVGYDNVDLEACRRRGIVVTNTPDVLTNATADLAVALLLSTVRRLPQAEASLRAGEFRGLRYWGYMGGDVEGAVLGIFGLGRIARAFARRMRPFGVGLQYHSRTRAAPEVEAELGLRWVGWESLLETSDILSLHAPYSAATHHVLDRAALRRMKRGSYLVNTARGALVDEAALVEVLAEGHLAGAGLDVYEHEPRVTPGLLELPNVVLLPHIGSATPATRTRMALLACRNVVSVLAGDPPITPVPR
jgi:glyoxylate reductase